MESEVNVRASRQDADRGSDVCGVEDNFEVGEGKPGAGFQYVCRQVAVMDAQTDENGDDLYLPYKSCRNCTYAREECQGQCTAPEGVVECEQCGQNPCLFVQGMSDCLLDAEIWAEGRGTKALTVDCYRR